MYRLIRQVTTTLALATAVALSTGCVATLYPVYTKADLVFDPALLGTWADTSTGEKAVITRGEKDGYVIVYTDDKGKSGRFISHLARVNGRLMLDLLPDTRDIAANSAYTDLLQPLHTFVYIDTIGSRMRITTLSPDSLGELLKRTPSAIAHLGNDDDRQFLTAPTRELQAFLATYSRRPKVMSDPSVWIRRSP